MPLATKTVDVIYLAAFEKTSPDGTRPMLQRLKTQASSMGGRWHWRGRAPPCAGIDKFSLRAAVRWHYHLVVVSLLEFMQRIVALVPGPRLRLTG